MASKFQNRLVGAIVLVALGVIVLPGLLDGQKKHYHDEFAAIPLLPKPGDREEPDMLPAVTQALPSQPPEGAAQQMRGGDAAGASTLPMQQSVADNSAPDRTALPARQAETKPQDKPRTARPEGSAEALSSASGSVAREKPAPVGRAYVIQLGALKNASKVNEIVAKLRGAGYPAYTSPSVPVAGKITRILVGPDASKDKLKRSLEELRQLSGLSGVVMGYSVD